MKPSLTKSKSFSMRSSSFDGEADEPIKERNIGGIKYKLDASHWLSTFVSDDTARLDGTKTQCEKMLRYDLRQLIRFGGLLTLFTKGTVFTMDKHLMRNILGNLCILSTVAAILRISLPEDRLVHYDTESLEQLASYVNKLVPFVLALYVSLVLQRWWALRVQALGQLFNAVSNTTMIMSASLPDESWRAVRDQVVRFGIASVLLVVKAARRDENLDILLEHGLLTEKEVDVVSQAQPYQRATTMWVWVLRVLEAAFNVGKVPAPRYNVILAKAQQARDGVQTIQTYLDTQLPFAYVHLITLLVNLHNIIVSVKCGALVGVAMGEGNVQRIVNQLVMCLLVSIIYQGLLLISYIVHDPFGDDILDFPVVAYTEYVDWSCSAFQTAAEYCPALGPDRLGWILQETQAAAVAKEAEKQRKSPKAGAKRKSILNSLEVAGASAMPSIDMSTASTADTAEGPQAHQVFRRFQVCPSHAPYGKPDSVVYAAVKLLSAEVEGMQVTHMATVRTLDAIERQLAQYAQGGARRMAGDGWAWDDELDEEDEEDDDDDDQDDDDDDDGAATSFI